MGSCMSSTNEENAGISYEYTAININEEEYKQMSTNERMIKILSNELIKYYVEMTGDPPAQHLNNGVSLITLI